MKKPLAQEGRAKDARLLLPAKLATSIWHLGGLPGCRAIESPLLTLEEYTPFAKDLPGMAHVNSVGAGTTAIHLTLAGDYRA